MTEVENILISVEHRYVLSMLNGTKTVELRRRPLRIAPGTRVWVYSKLPRGQVELVATADEVVAAPPDRIWCLYHRHMAISVCDFKEYLRGVDVGCAVILRDISPLKRTVGLSTLRRASSSFQPPQFFKRMISQHRELQCLMSYA